MLFSTSYLPATVSVANGQFICRLKSLGISYLIDSASLNALLSYLLLLE